MAVQVLRTLHSVRGGAPAVPLWAIRERGYCCRVENWAVVICEERKKFLQTDWLKTINALKSTLKSNNLLF